jgi:tetratricopeptide (TPR) repeat protein
MQTKMTFQYRVPRPVEDAHANLTFRDAEKLLLARLKRRKHNTEEVLWELAGLYACATKADKALTCFRQIMSRRADLEDKARCVLAMGATMERVRQYQAAVGFYKQAYGIEPMNINTWYWINNNLGFCLNALGRYEEGQGYCRSATQAMPNRPNAFKNLGISMEGLRKFAEAAKNYIKATQLDAADPRALVHLESLLKKHPQLEIEFGRQAELCRKAVRYVMLRVDPVPPPAPRKKRASKT